ncbi:MAG: ribose 1,5-bisphosphate isomerase [Thermoplasmatales archaeon]|nr:ribose 1,5-bisphosphate isomerase [Thermoplasmatales archaeon]
MGSNADILKDDIRMARLKGSSPMAIRTADAILQDAEEAFAEGSFRNQLKDMIQQLGVDIIASRPSNVTLRNSVKNTLYKLEKVDDSDDARVLEVVRGNVAAFKETVNTSAQKIALLGANIINDGDLILTCSYSAMVKGILDMAYNQFGKHFRVIVTETRPRYQGMKMANELIELGIPTTVIVDSAVRLFMKKIDLVLVGADTVSSDGSVISKIGTSLIALAAQEARVPVYVATPTFKFSEDTLSGVMVDIEQRKPGEITGGTVLEYVEDINLTVENPAFDATPPEYVRGLITELYIMSPYSVGEYLARLSGVID